MSCPEVGHFDGEHAPRGVDGLDENCCDDPGDWWFLNISMHTHTHTLHTYVYIIYVYIHTYTHITHITHIHIYIYIGVYIFYILYIYIHNVYMDVYRHPLTHTTQFQPLGQSFKRRDRSHYGFVVAAMMPMSCVRNRGRQSLSELFGWKKHVLTEL